MFENWFKNIFFHKQVRSTIISSQFIQSKQIFVFLQTNRADSETNYYTIKRRGLLTYLLCVGFSGPLVRVRLSPRFFFV